MLSQTSSSPGTRFVVPGPRKDRTLRPSKFGDAGRAAFSAVLPQSSRADDRGAVIPSHPTRPVDDEQVADDEVKAEFSVFAYARLAGWFVVVDKSAGDVAMVRCGH
ncbi:hypothetical protein ACWGR4_46205 [Embleya sp. NPDC055664]